MKVNKKKYIKKKPGSRPVPIENRFWEKVDIKDNNDVCWEWLASISKYGYGVITSQGKEYRAHRWAFKLFYGYIDDNLDVLHKCDNRKCVNPHHLRLGTKSDNMREREERGRRKHYPFGIHESHYSAKLTWKDVDKIREIYKGKHGEQSELARRYGVTYETIRGVVFEKTWKQNKRELYGIHTIEIKKYLEEYHERMKIISNRIGMRGLTY